jgi:hypothetical protein
MRGMRVTATTVVPDTVVEVRFRAAEIADAVGGTLVGEDVDIEEDALVETPLHGHSDGVGTASERGSAANTPRASDTPPPEIAHANPEGTPEEEEEEENEKEGRTEGSGEGGEEGMGGSVGGTQQQQVSAAQTQQQQVSVYALAAAAATAARGMLLHRGLSSVIASLVPRYA